MERVCVVVVLLVSLTVVTVTEATRIVFPGQEDLNEGDACVTPSGTPGTCSASCGFSSYLKKAAQCGVKDSAFLVCCDTNLDGFPDNLDVSPPPVSFDCAASSPQVIGTGLSAGPSNPAVGGESYRVTWPWMALVGRNETDGVKWYCQGILINEHWVLSEGYCFTDLDISVVRLGEYDYNDDFDGASPQDFTVTQIVQHPDYFPQQAFHSLALVKLGSRVAFQKYISPVCLPWGAESKRNITGRKAKLLSFNNRFDGSPIKSFQKEIEVTVFPVPRCQRSYSDTLQGIGEETLCAGDPNGVKDACVGDSGGPLVTQEAHGRYVVAGIASRGGRRCGDTDFPGLHVNLRYASYLAWIKKVAFANP